MKCTFVFTVCLVGINCLLAENRKNLGKQLSVKKRQDCDEYVCKDVYDADIATLSSMIDLLSSNIVDIQMAVDGLTSTVETQYAELSGSITTLETNYNSHTIRKCLNGLEYYTCDPYCGQKGEDWPNGVVNTVNFSSAFHKSPYIIISLQRYDDYDNSDLRFDIWVSNRSSSQFQFTVKTYQDSRMSYVNIGWLACA